MKNKLSGTIEYRNYIKVFSKVTDLPLQVVQLYVRTHKKKNINEVIDFFLPGLKGKYLIEHFIITKSDYLLLSPKDKKRYKSKDPVFIFDNSNTNKVECYVTNQFRGDAKSGILDTFCMYITTKGYKITINNIPVIQPNNKVKSPSKSQKENNRFKVSPLTPPSMGMDRDGYYVRYEDEILDKEKVPGLVEYLEREYERIVKMAKELLKDSPDICEFFHRIPVIISKKTEAELYEYSDEKRAEEIKKLFDRKGNNVTEKDILNILKEFKNFYDRIAGMYFSGYRKEKGWWNPHEGPYIEIYYRNIYADNINDYFSIAAMVLAHEYLHYLHNVKLGIDLFSRTDNKAKKVKEALADFFSVWYLVNTNYSGLYLAENRYDLWNERLSSEWPYSYATFFYPNRFLSNPKDYYQYGVINKYLAVFNEYDYDDALKKLMI